MTSEVASRARAIGWTAAGSREEPRVIEYPTPEPGRGEVLVRVARSAVNPADLRVSSGEFVGRFLHARVSPLVVGYDFSGSIARCGEGVDGFKVGDEVFGFLPYSGKTTQGAFAELICVGADAMARKPQAISHEVAAAAATPGVTALQVMRDLGGLRKGGRVLLIGAAGGVGSLAVGIAKKLEAKVVAVCSTYAVDFVRGLGADEVIDRRKQDPMTVAGPFDVVFDAAAAHGFGACKHLLAPGGAYVTTLPSPGVFLGKLRAMLSGRRCEFVAVKPLRRDLEQLATWVGEGMRAPVDARFPVKNLKQALDRLSKGEVRGRLVVEVDGGF
jgi:NADPH:quinone reductase-like Zn-dependent oxidoreductase